MTALLITWVIGASALLVADNAGTKTVELLKLGVAAEDKLIPLGH